VALQAEELVLRIYDWKTQEVYVEAPARINSRLLFAWIHSQEKIPWNEYFHIGEDRLLILDMITFPAFGAGIPEDKGRVMYVKNGLIHIATRELVLDGTPLTRGSALPEHTRLRLVIEKTDKEGRNDGNQAGR
jgi:hypothetical protein